MKRFLSSLLSSLLGSALLLLALSIPATGDERLPNPAVDMIHYRFHLTLEDHTDQIRGRAEITVRFLQDSVVAFDLDLVDRGPEENTGMEVTTVSRDGTELGFLHGDDRLEISLASPSEAQEWRTYTVNYQGVPRDGLIIATNRFGDRTFFGDNWPERARHWLPTVDHVSDKASVEWVVTAPEAYEVVGTGRLLERSDLGDGTELTHWICRVPVATKVMVIGVARFAMRNLGRVGQVPVQAWVYPQSREEGFHDFELAEKAVRFFTGHIGPFPYAKLANVQSKTRYGGMENASNVFYSEGAVRGDRENEGLIVHEIAHQWFGDSVTELDWTHLWLSEGFATYFTHLYNEFTYGRGRLVRGMTRDRDVVLRFHSRRPELALVPHQLTDPNEMLNRNVYQKGGWVLHMLRRQVGDEAFWDGIRTYYRRYRDRNADTEDLRRVMEQASGQELEWFFQQWAHEPGHPVLTGGWSFDPSTGMLTVNVRQTQGSGTLFRFPLDIGVTAHGQDRAVPRVETVEVSRKDQTFSFPVEGEPEEVNLDPHTWLLFQGELTRVSGKGR